MFYEPKMEENSNEKPDMTSNTARNKISFSFYCSILEIQISRQFSWNTPGGFVSGRMSKLYHLTAPTSPPLIKRHLKEEDSDEDEERDEEDGPLAELQEGLAAEEPHYPRF